MNEHALTKKITTWLAKLEAAGAPLWWEKTHGSRFKRNQLDLRFSVSGYVDPTDPMTGAFFGALELKNEETKSKPTPGQRREVERMRNGGWQVTITCYEPVAKGMIANALFEYGGWRHALTEPWLSREESDSQQDVPL